MGIELPPNKAVFNQPIEIFQSLSGRNCNILRYIKLHFWGDPIDDHSKDGAPGEV